MSFNATPKRSRPMAGEVGSSPFRSQNANRFRSSLVPMSRPAASSGPSRSGAAGQPTSSKLTGFSTNPRDLFRTTSTPKVQPFAPELPAAVTSKNASARKMAPQRSVLSGMSTTGAKDLFTMRIPSPDLELSGEALARQVPDDPTRTGSVYADQYLADKCPPHFDDLQRRQFFCILDLRRLKYAADEIFMKKDWKLNIFGFAKEYEKSRSIILLRYGLYKFKKVDPDPEKIRRWRLANGLSELSDDEGVKAHQSPDSRRTGASKRKAEEDKDTAFGASTSNKRRNVASDSTELFSSSKRRTVDEDEQRSTPSAASSAFAKILDKTQSPAAKRPSPTESATLSAFGNHKVQRETESAAPKNNPFLAASNGNAFAASASSIFSNPAKGASDGSILSSHKVGTVPASTSGIFSYLSESSNNSGNEIDDDEADEPEEAEEEEESEPASLNEHDSQEAAPSYNASAAASTGTNTPPIQSSVGLFPASTKSSTPNIFGAATQSNGVTAKGGLFGRVKMGSDGQPLRATPGPEDKENTATDTQQDTPAKPTGGDFTFDATNSPISFGAPAAKPIASEARPASVEPLKFGAVPGAKPASIFGTTGDSKATPAPLFGPLSNPPESSAAKPVVAAAPMFGAPKSATPTPSAAPLFASNSQPKESAAPLFGNNSQPKESAVSKPQDTANSIFAGFGAKSSTPTPSAPIFGASQSTKRGADDDGEPSFKRQAPREPSKASSTNLFGTSTPAFGAVQSNGQASQPATSFFGAAAKPAPSTSVFASASPSVSASQPESVIQQKPLFGSASSSEKAFSFGGSQPVSAPVKPVDAPSKSIFANAAPSGGSVFNFGAPAPPAVAPTKPSAPSFTFGAKPAEPAAPTAPSFSFGGSTNNGSPAVSFGATPTGPGSQSFDFNFGSGPAAGASSTFNFGAVGGNTGASGASSFTFSAGGNNGASISNPFAQANGASAAPPIFGAGTSSAPVASTPKPTPPSFNFGLGSSQTNLAQSSSMFGSQPNASITTNGGPSFSFTQATPQKDSGAPKQLGIFGGLGSFGGEGSARGGSPMPAPSSIGTTPVNGTPEPQTQQEDGDAEAPQAQLSLTEGGPGEEDETIVHEVRAKAIKYIPIDKDADEDDQKKSPWSTQGVGPLRVLKNKTTGTVRILLRAEPRGHIALNKALLSDVSYTAKDKTLNLMTSDDNGTGLETWVLQVKKPEFAQELASILEANKGANKR